MSYVDMENALLGVIRDLNAYTLTNTSIGDLRILNQGVEQAVILRLGPVIGRKVVQIQRRIETKWVVYIDLLIPFFREISEIENKIRAERQILLDQLDQYPTLKDTPGCIDAMVQSLTESVIIKGDPQFWWLQTMRMVVQERYSSQTLVT